MISALESPPSLTFLVKTFHCLIDPIIKSLKLNKRTALVSKRENIHHLHDLRLGESSQFSSGQSRLHPLLLADASQRFLTGIRVALVDCLKRSVVLLLAFCSKPSIVALNAACHEDDYQRDCDYEDKSEQ